MKWNESFLRRLGTSSKLASVVDAHAEAIAAQARSTAPVDTEEYRDSIHVEQERTPYRTISKVVAASGHSLAVEADTGNLARATKAAASRG